MRPTCVSRSRPSDCGERRRLARGQLRYCVRSFISGEPLIEHGPSGKPVSTFLDHALDGGFLARSFALPDHQTLACTASGPPAALLAADAERREGLDHAGGDRAAVRAASRSTSTRTTRRRRNSSRSIRTARSPRSSIRTDPAASRCGLFESGAILHYLAEKTGKLLPARCGAALGDASSGCFSRWAGSGPMFGQVGFFHKFAGKDFEDKRPLHATSRIKAPAGRDGEAPQGPRLDHGRRVHASPISRCWAGCAISSAFTRRAISWSSTP